MHSDLPARTIAFGQGVFYLLGGVWPLVHLRSFFAVTGPKTDAWLVQTVGALLAVIGVALLLVARRPRVDAEWKFLAAAAAFVLAAVDVIFVHRRVIPPIYLADAAAETLLVAAWLAVSAARRRASNRLNPSAEPF